MINNNNEALDLASTIALGIAQALSNTHTNLIGKIIKVNKKTIDVQPVIAREVNKQEVPLPVFPDVPVINFLGGTSSIQMPLKIGDYCTLFVSERCFDNWYFGNDNKKPLSPRMFDYSDCIALVGLKNQAGELDIPTTIKITGDTVCYGNWIINGNLTVNGNITVKGGDVVADGISLKNHTHPGDSGGTTGKPN
ncbi:Gp138 family membrane-puncturing spike protein [Aliarcobacter butzleri]